MERLVYLDTHVVVWLYAGDLSVFSKRSCALIEESELTISPIVMLELQYLFEIGRTNVKPNRIIANLGESLGLKISTLNFEKVIQKSLKESWTRDPFDRIIIAEAKLAKFPLITKDRNIRKHYKMAVW